MKKLLYAEDSDDDVFFMRRALKKSGTNAHLAVVNDGKAAIDYLSTPDNPPPEVVLLDLNMPQRNGFEVLEWIRSKSQLPELPVLILTSSNNEGDRERATALGASGYLVKPGQPEKLADLILPWI